MVRVILASILGAAVLFGWGAAAWMALPIHEGTIRKLPNEDRHLTEFNRLGMATGAYFAPYMPHDADEKQRTEVMEKHRSGPLCVLFYSEGGVDAMSPKMMGIGFGINLACAFIASLVVHLSRHACPRWFQRFALVMLLGVFAALYRDVALWNWMHFPTDWTLAMVIDVGLGWTLAGVFIAAIVKAKPVAATTA